MDLDTTSSDGVKKSLNYFSILIIIYFITDAQLGVPNGPLISLFGGTLSIVESSVYWLFVFLYSIFTYLTWRFSTLWRRLDLIPFIKEVPLIQFLQFDPINNRRTEGLFSKELQEVYQFTFVGKKWATHFPHYEIAIGSKKQHDTPVAIKNIDSEPTAAKDIDSAPSVVYSSRMQLTGIARVLSGYQADVVYIPIIQAQEYFDLPQGVQNDDEIILSMSFYKRLRRQVFTHTTFLADTFLPWLFPVFAHGLVAFNFAGSILDLL